MPRMRADNPVGFTMVTGTGSKEAVAANRSRVQKKTAKAIIAIGHLNALRRKSHHIAMKLHKIYGSPNHENKQDPVDELIFIVLSQMTTHKVLIRVYNSLKSEYDDWQGLSVTSISRLKHLIRPAGLGDRRAGQLKSIAAGIEKEFGLVSLDSLRQLPDREVERFLISLPGVGLKTAKCVMLFSLGRHVLPVDTHVLRVARRLGLLSSNDDIYLEEIVAPKDRYRFHVNMVAHGRGTCRAVRPRCMDCCLRAICSYRQGKSEYLHATQHFGDQLTDTGRESRIETA